MTHSRRGDWGHYCLVDFDLGGKLDVVVVQHTSAQTTQGLAGFADASCDFLVDSTVRRDDGPQVPELVDSLQLSIFNIHFGWGCSCAWGWLVQDLGHVETDGEAKQSRGFREPVDDGLEVRLRVRRPTAKISTHSKCAAFGYVAICWVSECGMSRKC